MRFNNANDSYNQTIDVSSDAIKQLKENYF